MSKLKIYNNGVWVDPTNISVYQNGAWNSLTRVNYRNNNAWEEVWPLEDIPVDQVTDYLLIKLSVAEFDLMKQVELINPKPDTIAFTQEVYAAYGAKFQQNVNGNARLIANNTRPIFAPERVIASRVGSRATESDGDLGVLSLNDGKYCQLVTGDAEEYMFFVDYVAIKNDWVNANLTDFQWTDPDIGIGETIRLGLFLGWSSFTSLNTNQTITVTYEFYEGGSPVYDEASSTISIDNPTDIETFNVNYVAPVFDGDTEETAFLNYYYNVNYIDYDFTQNVVSLNEYEQPPLISYERGIQLLTSDINPSNTSEQEVHPVWWIESPRTFPDYLDGPTFDQNGDRVGTIRGVTDVGDDGMGQFDGRDVMATGGRFRDTSDSSAFYPSMPDAPSSFLEQLWWMQGWTNRVDYNEIVFGTDDYQYMLFDIWQYKFDNPDVDEVTLYMGAYVESTNTNAAPAEITVDVNSVEFYSLGNDSNFNKPQKAAGGSFGGDYNKKGLIGSVTKTVGLAETSFAFDNFITDPNDLTLVLSVTINLNTGAATVTQL